MDTNIVLKYLIMAKNGEFLTTIYKNSTSYDSSMDSAMKLDSVDEARIIAKLASERSNVFKDCRILVLERSTYFLDAEKIPSVDEESEI